MRRILLLSFVFVLLIQISLAENISDNAIEIVKSFKSMSDDDLAYIKDGLNKEIENRSNNTKSSNSKLNSFGNWAGKYFVNKFNEPTNQKYITYTKKITGSFSDTAVNSKDLSVKIIINLEYDINNEKKPKIAFELLKYGNYKISEGQYRVYIKGNGKYFSFLASNYGRLTLPYSSSDINDVVDVFKSDTEVKFSIEGISGIDFTGSFTIDETAGFNDAYEWLFSK